MSTVKKTASDPTRKHVVIVGGGFAGLRCAQALATVDNIRVTLLDKKQLPAVSSLCFTRWRPPVWLPTGLLLICGPSFLSRAMSTCV